MKAITLFSLGFSLFFTLATSLAIGRAPAMQPLAVPAGPGSGMYTLAATTDGQTYLSWIEPDGAGHALKFSRLENSAWTEVRVIARGTNWFVNWADKPAIAALPDGTLMAHWLVNTEGKQRSDYSYGLKIVHSSDRGQTWREVFAAGMDNVADYTGFLAFEASKGEFLAAYLTPLAQASPSTHGSGHGAGHIKTLRLARFAGNGQLHSDVDLDPDVCTCCPVGVAYAASGPVVVYRDHREGEIRDISIVRHVNGRWTEPEPVHRDEWKIAGCPTNGPVIAANAERLAVAWFTAANDQPRVRLAFSDAAGARFAAPIQIDEGQPVGWPSVVLLDDGSAAVSWLERRGDASGIGDVRVRRIRPDGKIDASLVVATTVSGRAAGMPQMIRAGHQLVFAWRSHERVESAIMPLQVLNESGPSY